MAEQSCTVKARIDYRSAPAQVLEDKRLCDGAKVLLMWAFMRGNGWEFRIGYALSQVHISEKRWLRMRKVLIEVGYLQQRKLRHATEDGRTIIAWENVITDEPLLSPHFVGIQKEGMQNVGMQKGGNTNTQVNKNLSKQLPHQGNLDEIAEALLWERQHQETKVMYLTRWKAKAISEMKKNGGASKDELATLDKYLRHKRRSADVETKESNRGPQLSGDAARQRSKEALSILREQQ